MKNFKLDSYEKRLLDSVKDVDDETLLNWAGYNSKREFEDAVEDNFSRELLILTNYEDILSWK